MELVEGDFLVEGPRRVAAGSVDAIVTSPPYNLGVAYASYQDDLSPRQYLEWTDRWGAEARRALTPRGSLFVNLGSRPSDPAWPWEVARALGRRFRLQNVIHWVKSISIARRDAGRSPGLSRDITVGHYKPINSPRFLNDAHEYIFHFTVGGDVELDRLAIGVPYEDVSNVGRWSAAGQGLHCRGNVWFIPYPTIQWRHRDRPHPATFPARLPEMCLRLHGLARLRRAMDPFLGLGASAEAAARLGVPFIGFEIEPAYLDYARRRLRDPDQSEIFETPLAESDRDAPAPNRPRASTRRARAPGTFGLLKRSMVNVRQRKPRAPRSSLKENKG